jgi:release factor glutamine methyltransferase
MQIVEALKHAQQQLDASDSVKSDSIRLDTEILLSSILKCERTHLYTYPEQVLSSNEIESFNRLIDLRSEGQPVAHLINQKEFWSLTFHITKDTLIPRPETEMLVETALKLIPTDSTNNILDLGTGSGAIAIAIASERPLTNITATDASDEALSIAKSNANSNNIKNIEFIKANWFKFDTENNQAFDLIISNPPYISNDDPHLKQGDVRFEPHTALASGEDGLDDLRIIIRESANNLTKEGWLLVEHGYNQGEPVRNLFIENGFTSTSTIKDYSDNERVSIGQLI